MLPGEMKSTRLVSGPVLVLLLCFTLLPSIVVGIALPAAVCHERRGHLLLDIASRANVWLKSAWNRWTDNLSPTRTFPLTRALVNDTSHHIPNRHEQGLILRFTLSSASDTLTLLELAQINNLDTWASTEQWLDLRISKDEVSNVLSQLPPFLRSNFRILMNETELSRAVDNTFPAMALESGSTTHWTSDSMFASQDLSELYQSDVFFKDYQPLSVITPWMHLLTSLYSSHVDMISVGVSFEGRDILALKVGAPTDDDGPLLCPRRTVIVSGGSHAREWISTSTVNYIAHAMISSYASSASVQSLVSDFDWIFIPTLNPDGYLYTWTDDRLWRKSRQRSGDHSCAGIDLDRTWDYMWDGEQTPGDHCSETFAGDSPFEGIESRRFAEWARNQTEYNNVEFVGFLDLHSYSQQILYPFSYSCETRPPSLEDLEELAEGLAKAIRTKGHKNYKVTPACKGNVDFLQSSKGDAPSITAIGGGGSALDWFYHEMHVRNAFQIKLRDTGSYGFLLPRHYIVPTGAEVLEAVLYFGHYLSSKSKGSALGDVSSKWPDL